MQKLLYLIIILLLFNFLNAKEILTYSITSLGIPFAKIKIIDNNEEKLLSVIAKSKFLGNIFENFDNRYFIEYKDDYIPIKYKKIINQENYKENREIIYNHKQNTAKRISYLDSLLSASYRINTESRDLFSALYYSRNKTNNDSIYINCSSMSWKFFIKQQGKKKIKTNFGKKKCNKITINFKRTKNIKKEKSDIFTYGLPNENCNLTLWIGDDNFYPFLITYNLKKINITWTLKKIETL